MFIRWTYNPELSKVDTIENLDDERARTFITDRWAVASDGPEAPAETPQDEHADEGESA